MFSVLDWLMKAVEPNQPLNYQKMTEDDGIVSHGGYGGLEFVQEKEEC